jgi:hypothetical protein
MRAFGQRKIQLPLLIALGLLALPIARHLKAQQSIDLTLLFHSAVHGKIAPCG